MTLSKKCGNCAFACLINPPNRLQIDTVLCMNFCETIEVNNSCSHFDTHENKGFFYSEVLPKSRYTSKTIQKQKYPIHDPGDKKIEKRI